MDEKRSRKYREKVKCYICKKMFNSDYKDKHSQTRHNDKKVKHSYVLEGQSHSHQSDCEPRNIFLKEV